MKTYTRKKSSYLKKVFNSINFDETCRLCLREDSNVMIPLFTEAEIQYKEWIEFAVDIIVEEDDRLPHNICEDCLSILESTYTFKKKCYASEKKLREHRKLMDLEEEEKALDNASFHLHEEVNVVKLEDDIVKNQVIEEPVKTSFVIVSGDTEQNVEAVEEPALDKIVGDNSKGKLVLEISELWNKESDDDDDDDEEEQTLLDISTSAPGPVEVVPAVSESQIVEEDIIEVQLEACHTTEDVKPKVLHTVLSKTYSCSVCHKYFSSYEEAVLHSDKEHGSNLSMVSCYKCKKKFSAKTSLDRHLLVHTGKKPFRCKLCKKSFNQKSILKRHMYLHQEVKPFKCSLCEKSYAQKDNLKQHMRVHGDRTDESLYQCKLCDKSFVHCSGLSRHRAFFHKGKTYNCPECSNHYTDPSALRRHVKARHELDK